MMNGSWLLVGLLVGMALPLGGEPLECMQRFEVQDFVIGAWWGPDPSERNYELYKEAGFNVLMTYRNRANPKYGEDYQLPDLEMELANDVGLWVMLDTYMKNETPWGGIEPDPPSEHPDHHPARLEQLKWLEERYGDHRRLCGYLLGDNCGLHGYMVDNARYLEETSPGLFAWMSTNPSVESQADAPMPLLTSQNYPFLYQVNEPEPTKRNAYCSALERDRRHAEQLDMALWPFLNCTDAVSPSQLRFQISACLAYGAQGIWYFHYNDNVFDPATEEPDYLYETAKESNLYVQAVGDRLLGHRCIGVYHAPDEMPAGALTPGGGEWVETLSDGVMVGLLAPEAEVREGDAEPAYLVIVDKRTVRFGEEEPGPQRASVRLGAEIEEVELLLPDDDEIRRETKHLGTTHRLILDLRPGEGILVAVK